MEIIEIQAPIYKFKIPEDVGNKVREVFENYGGKYSFTDITQKISNTDWHMPTWPRPYADILVPYINDICLPQIYTDTCPKMEIVQTWFQQYETGDYHSWHFHGKCMFSSVFYVELPENTETTFKDHNRREFKIDVKQDDYIVFPSYLLHCSPVNETQKRKTIVAMNLNDKENMNEY